MAYPWAHYVDGSTHMARCSTCGVEITRWLGPDITSPPGKHRRLIDEHVNGCGGWR